jgi:hypothetical protein
MPPLQAAASDGLPAAARRGADVRSLTLRERSPKGQRSLVRHHTSVVEAGADRFAGRVDGADRADEHPLVLRPDDAVLGGEQRAGPQLEQVVREARRRVERVGGGRPRVTNSYSSSFSRVVGEPGLVGTVWSLPRGATVTVTAVPGGVWLPDTWNPRTVNACVPGARPFIRSAVLWPRPRAARRRRSGTGTGPSRGCAPGERDVAAGDARDLQAWNLGPGVRGESDRVARRGHVARQGQRASTPSPSSKHP